MEGPNSQTTIEAPDTHSHPLPRPCPLVHLQSRRGYSGPVLGLCVLSLLGARSRVGRTPGTTSGLRCPRWSTCHPVEGRARRPARLLLWACPQSNPLKQPRNLVSDLPGDPCRPPGARNSFPNFPNTSTGTLKGPFPLSRNFRDSDPASSLSFLPPSRRPLHPPPARHGWTPGLVPQNLYPGPCPPDPWTPTGVGPPLGRLT